MAQWIAKGKTSDKASIIVGISPRTVEQHVQSAMLKFGATNRVQRAVEAAKLGLEGYARMAQKRQALDTISAPYSPVLAGLPALLTSSWLSRILSASTTSKT